MKEGEEARRAEEAIGIINVMAIAEEIYIPQQIQKFWASSKNKENIQQFMLVKYISLGISVTFLSEQWQ